MDAVAAEEDCSSFCWLAVLAGWTASASSPDCFDLSFLVDFL